uniref:NADH-ubiquinone oxidoreductase chain 4 n=1 Tax=Dicyema japonicum TaxID=399803 RepID=A0A3G1SC07_DICJA|nr:NADH dehydrogenase subunit 4 [Dicyema japonicum]
MSLCVVVFCIVLEELPILWNMRVDSCSKVFVLMSSVVLVMIMLLPMDSMNMYNTAVLSVIVVITMSMVFVLESPILFYVFFELSVIPLGILLVSHGEYPERLLASSYLYLYTFLGSIPMFVVVLYLPTPSVFELWNDVSYSIWVSIMLVALLVKLPMFSLHLWLPKAHSQSPVLGSVLLAALALKLSSYGLIRLISNLTDLFGSFVIVSIFVMSLFGMLVSSFITSLQADSKVYIAYSSVAHMGLCVCVALSGGCYAFASAVTLSVVHAIVSSGYFLMAHFWSLFYSSRSLYLIKSFGSLHRWSLVVMLLLAMGNTSTPPWFSYLSEVMFFGSVLSHTSYGYLCVVLLLLIYVMVGVYTVLLFAAVIYGVFSSTSSLHMGAMSVFSYSVFVVGCSAFLLQVLLL